jgi:plasmid stabilization system protein ParE
MTTVRTSGRADREVARVDKWWRENRTAAPDLFLDEFVATTRRLGLTPEIGAPYQEHGAHGIRRVLMQTVRYYAYYRYDAERDEVVIVSVWAGMRRRGPKLSRP